MEDKSERYRAFLAAHPPRTRAGLSYWDLGSGPAILFLHGMAGGGDIWFQQLLAFKDRYRVIAPSYRAREGLEGLTRGVLRLLDALGVGEFFVVGSSLGGYAAQYLLKIAPERVRGELFFHTFPPDPAFAARVKKALGLARILPWPLLRAFLIRHPRRVVVPAGDHDPFLGAYLVASYRRLDKAEFLGRGRAVATLFAPPRPRVPLGIVEAKNDPLLPLEVREHLKKAYPTAWVETLDGGGHFSYVNRPEAANRAIRRLVGP